MKIKLEKKKNEKEFKKVSKMLLEFMNEDNENDIFTKT